MDSRTLQNAIVAAIGEVDVATGVPCSVLQEWIREIDRNDEVSHVNAANEGESIGIAVGAHLAGRNAVVYLQNSGLGNAVNPIASLASTFEVPLFLLIGYRGEPGSNDEPQHELMGRATLKFLSALEIDVHLIADTDSLNDAVQETRQKRNSGRTQAWLVPPGTLRASSANAPDSTGQLPSRADYITALSNWRRDNDPSTVVMASTGMSGRDLYAIDPRPQDFYMVGSMGCISSLALGTSFGSHNRSTVILDGDGAFLMRLEAIVTLVAFARSRMVHVVVDNAVHETTGGQSSLSGSIDIPSIARSVGYASTREVRTCEQLYEGLQNAYSHDKGVHLIVAKASIHRQSKSGRPKVAPAMQARTFSHHLQADT